MAINENWDPDVRDDMEMMLNRIVPEDLPFRHSCEGPDDMVSQSQEGCSTGLSLYNPIQLNILFSHVITLSLFQPAHVKACFLGSNLTVPVSDGKLNLGTWQGVWLCEHRDRAGSRKVSCLLLLGDGCDGDN